VSQWVWRSGVLMSLSGVRLAVSLSARQPSATPCCPLAPEMWLCSWPEEGGPRLSASLRPGDPLPRPTQHTCLWRGQMQSGGRERAGSSQLMDGTRTTRALIGKLRFVAEVATGECRCSESRGSINDDRGDGGWRAQAVGGERERRFQAGQTTRPGPRRGVPLAAFPSSPLGRLVRRSTPWRGASLPPGTAARSHAL
jgi:hypothetical protein